MTASSTPIIAIGTRRPSRAVIIRRKLGPMARSIPVPTIRTANSSSMVAPPRPMMKLITGIAQAAPFPFATETFTSQPARARARAGGGGRSVTRMSISPGAQAATGAVCENLL